MEGMGLGRGQVLFRGFSGPVLPHAIKGVASVKTSGRDFDAMKAKITIKNPALPARSLIIMKITEVFGCRPGQKAGSKIL